MHAVPVLRRDYRHVVDGKIFVQSVEGGAGSSAAAHGNRGSRFIGQQRSGGVEQAVEQCAQRTVGPGIIDRRPYHDAVGTLQLFSHPVVQFVIEYAPAQLSTASAGDAPLNRLGADGYDFGFDTIGFQSLGHFQQGNEGIPLFVGGFR